MNDWLSVDQVAKELGVQYRTVHSLLNKGELVGYRIARNYRIKPEDVDAYLEAARIKPGELNHLVHSPAYDAPRVVVDLRAVESSAS